MNYNYSQTDKSNLDWFKNDDSKATLMSIELRKGNLRGLSPFIINFEYPITVIAGKNGTGKSTILALAACAYHNADNGYKLPDRKNTYYTFQDFFVQTSDEIPIGGLDIYYGILHNNWRKNSAFPTGKGLGYQLRTKKKGGKWNGYQLRVKRNVVYYGINRIVPHNEKSVSKFHKKHFGNNQKYEWNSKVKKIVGRILNKDYNEFQMYNYNKYKLPVVKCGDRVYSGFNMGAGENALFEIFSTIFSSPLGSLIIIDEIELGLHGEAQQRLIYELKELCKERKIQIICTTHSKVILESVPPESRFFIENILGKIYITPKIASNYAGAKLLGENSKELYIFVEDDIGEKIIQQTIDNEYRKRCSIHCIGSASAIARQLAASYKITPIQNCIAFLDGDQTSKKNDIVSSFIKYLESVDDSVVAKQWVESRIYFLLRDDAWPEKCILNLFQGIDRTEFAEENRIDKNLLDTYIQEALLEGKHKEFYSLSKKMGCNADFLFRNVVIKLNKHNNEYFSDIRDTITSFLK